MKFSAKKITALVLACIMVLCLAACGGSDDSGNTPSSGGNTSPTGDASASSESADGFTPVEWRMANQHPLDSFVTAADQESLKR
jgi:hypothetical protein